MKDFFYESLKESEAFSTLVDAVSKQKIVSAFGMTDVQKNHIAGVLGREMNRPVLYVTHSDADAVRSFEDLSCIVGEGVYLFPAREISLFYVTAESREIACRRMEVLYAILKQKAKVIVACAEALQYGLTEPDIFKKHILSLKVGEIAPPDRMAENLIHAGYERAERVDTQGQFCAHGGLLDVFPVNASGAYRIEWFDDEVDSIRLVDPITQRSLENCSSIEIPPAQEILMPDEECALNAADRLRDALKRTVEKRSGVVEHPVVSLWDREDDPGREITPMERMRGRVMENADMQAEGKAFPNMEAFAGFLLPGFIGIDAYLENPVVVLDEPDRVRSQMESRRNAFLETYKDALERGEALLGQEQLMAHEDDVLHALTGHGAVLFSTFLKTMANLKPEKAVKLEGMSCSAYHGRFKDLAAELKSLKKDGWRVALFSGGEAKGLRLRETLFDLDVSADYAAGGEIRNHGTVTIYPLSLSQGFLYPQLRLALISDADLYGSIRQQAKHKVRKNAAERIAAFTDLNVGDFVVHESHGVGIYKGTVHLQSEGLWRDYLYIQYAGSDKLYVPTEQMDRVQRYIGSDGETPKLNKLGGTEWNRQKQKTKASIKTIAFDLVKLYAARKEAVGFAFSPDTPWQQEFEDNFPYEETPDQLQAVEEIKRDMESPCVMDRLLCGDVGYGKTEVALRAAFKAVMDSKQVAILAPTTVLAQQHYNTLLKRFDGFPVKIEVISRFKSAAEQKEIADKAASGAIDILVGTHRLLGKDINFARLGLLIIDEEQRFGVQHKETIKNMKKNVDVLTLSATPIPRTLNMSMVGIRDMSVLETPPEERFPVQTYVTEYSDGLVRDALMRELRRGGQAYVLYNQVRGIEEFHARLQALVPEARIAVGHGQMREHALENVMLDFFEGKYDVLLCTTIIESGLDVPNCNTLIVCNADCFGLSQLYQIRGRVGRSNRLAYAYMTVKPGQTLSETADKRLRAIRDFTSFGSGFRIAMRDLELRGAGDLLGAQQHGFLATVGYDMYCKLMEETIREIRGEQGETIDVETRVEYPVDAYLPNEYVPTDVQRVELYKRIAVVDSFEAREDLLEEIIDRYGTPPPQVEQLLDVAQIKCACSRIGIELVSYQTGQVRMKFAKNALHSVQKLIAAVGEADKRLVFSATDPPVLILRGGGMTPRTLLRDAVKAMTKVSERMTG